MISRRLGDLRPPVPLGKIRLGNIPRGNIDLAGCRTANCRLVEARSAGFAPGRVFSPGEVWLGECLLGCLSLTEV